MDRYMIPKTIDNELENYEKELENNYKKDFGKYKEHSLTNFYSYGLEYDILLYMEKVGLANKPNNYIIYNDLLDAIKNKEECDFKYLSDVKDMFNCLDFVKEKNSDKKDKPYSYVEIINMV